MLQAGFRSVAGSPRPVARSRAPPGDDRREPEGSAAPIAVNPAVGAVPCLPPSCVFQTAITAAPSMRSPACAIQSLVPHLARRGEAVRRQASRHRWEAAHVPQLGYETGQVGGHLALIVYPFGLIGMALDPSEDGPCERIFCGGRPAPEGSGTWSVKPGASIGSHFSSFCRPRAHHRSTRGNRTYSSLPNR